MFNYRIKCVNACSVFKNVTAISLVVGGIGGLSLGLLARSMVGILGGLFLGFIFGLANGIVAYLYTFLFNLFASFIGGIEIQLNHKDAFLDSLVQPIPLVNATNSNDTIPDQAIESKKPDNEV